MSSWQNMLGAEAITRLGANHQQQRTRKGTPEERDFAPVCKIFLPWTAATWLLTELDDQGLAFGLADLGHGQPEQNYISLDEIWEVQGPGGLQVERDMHFLATKTLSQYASAARQLGRIDA